MRRKLTLSERSSRKELNEVFVGRTVTIASEDTLTLDDGTVLSIVPNSGAACCSSGNYNITELNGCDNIITGCKLVESEDNDWYRSSRTWQLFVYSGHKKVNLLTISGTDGNGYYGTGFVISVQRAEDLG